MRSPTVQRTASLLSRPRWTCPSCLSRLSHAPQSTLPKRDPPDHRKLGLQQDLFLTSHYSPGSPIFLPRGTIIFNRLVDFLRKQYVKYGFQEVITPTMYKKALWAKSGHLQNYADDMYTVTGGGGRSHADDQDEYGLKPMNCPGHCLVFAAKVHSYRELPVRYADFGALHRNEVSGALSGLTRVRRFHQDDGHIFCRPCQVQSEIEQTLGFVRAVYGVLRLGVAYRLALSTRPTEHFVGTVDEWDRAEAQLKKALDRSGMEWSLREGDGAFYGPKIDIVIEDSDGKEHQTATIQLDFQLPKRFELEYQAPAPECEARGETTEDPALLAEYGPVRPVMIHRAVLGSVERLMALLIESYDGRWPFWLNPRQAIILTVNTSRPVLDWADHVKEVLLGLRGEGVLQPAKGGLVRPTGLAVDVDSTARSLGSKLRDARSNGYGHILVVGEDDVKKRQVSLGKQQMSPAEMRDKMRAMADAFE